MLPSVNGPTELGPDAYAVAAPRRGETDELVWENLCFSTPTGYRPLFLDLHVPRADPATPPPLVVWVHGGGWESGSRRRFPAAFGPHWFLPRILLAGYAVALVDYRLSSEAPFPAPVEDVRAALSWLADHADDLGFDAGRLVLWGESAGAHLALLAGARRTGTPDVAAVVDWYGPSDLPALAASTAEPTTTAGEPAVAPETELALREGGWGAETASPVRVLGADAPPVFIAHGLDDSVVPVSQSRLLRQHLERLGVRVEYHETDGGHVFEGSDVLPEMISRSLAFIGRTLGDAGGHSSEHVVPAPATVVRLDAGPAPSPHELQTLLDGGRLVLAGEARGAGRAVEAALSCLEGGVPVAALLLTDPVVDPAVLGPGALAGTDLRRLCPVLVGVGALAPSFEETLRLVLGLRQAGVPTRLRVFPTLGDGIYAGHPTSAATHRAVQQLERDLTQLLQDGTLS